MYTGVHSDVSRESYSFELFDLPLDVPLVREINQGYVALPCIPVDSFDLRCESVTYISCNMGTHDLPNMYALYISGKSRMAMLQVLCITLFP